MARNGSKRARRSRRGGGGGSGGAMSSLRGGFRSAVKGATGKASSPRSRLLWNIIYAVLIVVAAALLLRRMGLGAS